MMQLADAPGYVVWVESPFTKNDAGGPVHLVVMVDHLDQVPEALALAIETETAHLHQRRLTPDQISSLIRTYEVRKLRS